MSEAVKKFLILSILYGSGIVLVWWSTSWKAALGVFILLWAARAEARFDLEDRENAAVAMLNSRHAPALPPQATNPRP